MALYIGFILLVFLSSIYLAINMNRRRIRLLGLFAPVVFTLCMLKVLESNIRLPESGALEAGILMFLYGFPLIIGSLIFTLIRLCFVYQKKIWKALLIFISYILESPACRCLGHICGIRISDRSFHLRSHFFDDSGLLSSSYLSLLFRPRSIEVS